MKAVHFSATLIVLLAGATLADPPTDLPCIGGMPGSLETAAIVGDHAYCATPAGLLVLDIADPTQTRQVALLPAVGWARDITVSGNHAYLLVWDLGLLIVDIADPAAPRLVGTCPAPAQPGGVGITGHHAIVSDMGLGLCIIDVADPADPQVVTTVPLTGEFHGLDLVDDVAYLAANESDLYIVDVSTPAVPSVMNAMHFSGQVRDVAVRDGLAYLACGSFGLRVFDVTDGHNPVAVSHRVLQFDLSYSAWAGSVSLGGHHVYVGLQGQGLGVVDVSDPSAPVDVVRSPLRGTTMTAAIRGDEAFVSAGHGGLVVLDISDPVSPLNLHQHWLLGMVTDVEVANDCMLVAGGYACAGEKSTRSDDAGLLVVDLAAPQSPTVIGRTNVNTQPAHLACSGDLAFMAASYGGIHIHDVTDPGAPEVVGTIPTTTEGYAHAVDGDHLYTYLSGDFLVMDVSDPAVPEVIGTVDLDFHGDLAAANGVAYSTVSHLGLRTIDVSDPALPTALGWLDLPSGAQEPCLLGDRLYVANGLSGLSVVDVSDPSHPTLLGSCDLPGYAHTVACRWPYAYVAAAEFGEIDGGLRVVDVSDPTAPVHVAGFDIPGYVEAVAVDGSMVYVGARYTGVLMFRHDATTGTETPAMAGRLVNRPNPFNPLTVVGFDVPRSGHVSVMVYDVAGRHVRTLVDGVRSAGMHEVAWNGLDERGRAVSSGVYLARMVAGEVRGSRAMVLAR